MCLLSVENRLETKMYSDEVIETKDLRLARSSAISLPEIPTWVGTHTNEYCNPSPMRLQEIYLICKTKSDTSEFMRKD